MNVSAISQIRPAMPLDIAGTPLPAMDYEEAAVDSIGEAFARERDPFADTLAPDLPMGLNLGRQIYYIEKRHPDLFAGRRLDWRRSDAPWSLRLALPVIFALPIGADRRRQLSGAACHLARRRGVGA